MSDISNRIHNICQMVGNAEDYADDIDADKLALDNFWACLDEAKDQINSLMSIAEDLMSQPGGTPR